jgi:hypothetical protein
MRSQAIRWAQEKFGGASFNDQRMTKRFVSMMATLATKPAGRVSEAFSVAAQRQGAYDFLEHKRIGSRAVQDAVGDACARDCRALPCALIALDGTSLNIADHDETKGFGRISAYWHKARGLKLLNALALSVDGVTIGVPAQRYWIRDAVPKSKRVYRAAGQRESVHWRDAVGEVTERFQRLAPQTRLHFIADREADASLFMADLIKRGLEFTVRGKTNRKLVDKGLRVPVRAKLIHQKPVARVPLLVPSRPGRRQREVTLLLRVARVPLILRDRHFKKRRIHQLTVVWARESGRVPVGQERVEWLLYTTDNVTSAAGAKAVLQRYSYRWRIEEMHRTLKSGLCRVEEMQLRSVEAATKWASMNSAIAARAERLKQRSRLEPELPASEELTATEIRALVLLKREEKKKTELVSDGMPTIAQAVRWIADLGGYVGSKSSGPPGSIVIGRGLDRVRWAAKAIDALEKKR